MEVPIAERIMKYEAPTFQISLEEIIFSDIFGHLRITNTMAEGITQNTQMELMQNFF
jgi:hypothetical protein